jgi:hypothetical protein
MNCKTFIISFCTFLSCYLFNKSIIEIKILSLDKSSSKFQTPQASIFRDTNDCCQRDANYPQQSRLGRLLGIPSYQLWFGLFDTQPVTGLYLMCDSPHRVSHIDPFRVHIYIAYAFIS